MKKVTGEAVQQLKKIIQNKKFVIGAEIVLKRLKAGKLNQIYFASNCPQKTKNDLLSYAKLTAVPVIELEMDNEELGIFCKKIYFISVLGSTE